MAPVSELMMDAPRVLPEALAALRADLAPAGGADFTVDAVQELLGPVANAALGREQAEITITSPSRRINPSFRIATLYFLYRGVSML